MTKARDNSKFGNFAGNEVFLDSDKDTSITADTDDQIDIKTGGTDRVHIDSSGNVGIGTSSPGADLHIASLAPSIRLTDTNDSNVDHFIEGSGSALVLYADKNNELASSTLRFSVDGTERMRIDSSGNVGIGTSNPTAKFNVESTGDTGMIMTKTGQSAWLFQTLDSGVFRLYSNTASAERIRIDGSGNVGIGTTSPNAKLHIHGGDQTTANIDTSSNIVLNVAGTGASPNNGGSVVFSANDGAWRFAAIKGLVTSGADNTVGDLAFSVRNATTNSTLSEAMRINSSGDVLIGKTTTGTTTNGVFLSAERGTNFVFPSSHYVIFNRNASGAATMLDFRVQNVNKGSISFNGTGTSYNTSSDYRLKENVEYTWDATTRLKQLKPARFNFIDDTDRTVDGFIAHEVSDIVPEAITGEKDATKVQDVYDDDGNVTGTETVPDYQGIDQSKLVPLLVKTIQELEARITALENN